jgi:DNA-binding NtrC family response regulator
MIPQLGGGEYPPTSEKLRDRVLVVDGEPLVRWALTASLTAAGYDVVTAANGADACEIAAQDPQPAVVLLDLRPQDTHGQAFFDEIRRVAPLCRLLVLTTERCGGAPPGWLGSRVIEKPFDLAEVVRLVGAAIPAD